MTILEIALRLGRGEIDWCAAVDSAVADDLHRDWCEQASVSDEAAREAAIAGVADGSIDSLAGYERLAARVNGALTDAAARLVAAEAYRLRDAAIEADHVAAVALRDRKLDLCREIEAALPACEQTNHGFDGFGSLYYRYREVKIRVSDHAQVAGGGWNAGTGERHGESDVSFVVAGHDSPLPSRREIRARVARVLRDRLADMRRVVA